MYLYVQKWVSLKVYLKLLNLRLLDFLGCNHCGCFFVVASDLDRGQKGCENEGCVERVDILYNSCEPEGGITRFTRV